ncbi:tetratricopeptide repeat protein [uncultured Maribacter sp.]|uniref:tetratricopeptide repeat protein n=1 Tax=uncultured Maribacter sp. TaxID=431308 RepID=UPI0030EF05A4|tara:strand:- start:35612 stop:37519 length:1908 start_codon:yes stop_codon:yes gene_type:complete
MKTVSKIFLLIGFCLCIDLHSQEYKNLDSLVTEYNNHVNDTTKVTLGSLIYQNLSFTNPEESYKYAKEAVSISKQIMHERGLGQAYNNLSFYFLNKDQLDSALYYKKASLDIATRLQNIRGILTVNMGLAVLYNKKNNFNKAEEYLNQNIAIFKNRDTIKNAREIDFKYIGSTYHALSDIMVKRGQYNLALKNQLRSLELYKEKTKDPLFEADAYNALGQTEMKLENYEQSFVYLKQALKVYNEFKDLLWESDVLKIMGENMVLQNKPTEALKYLLRCIEIAKENEFQLTEASAHNILGNAYNNLNRNQEALQSLNKAVEVYGQMENPTEVNEAYISLGVFYNKANQPNRAIPFFEKAIIISDSIGAIPQASYAYFHRSKSFQELKEYKKSLEDFVLYNNLKDSIYTIKKSQQIEEMRTIFETEKKEVEIALQEEEIKALNEKGRADNLKKGLYAGGMTSALALSGLLVFGFRQRMKKNKVEREKQEEIYKQEIAHKKKELTSQTLHLVQKNTFIQELRENLEGLRSSPEKFKVEFRRIVMLLKKQHAEDKDWEIFKSYFADVHNNFDNKLKSIYADITEKEIRLAAFLRMNLTTKEIAATLNVLPDSILKSKYRLKKKLNLDKDTDLTTFLNTL